jgi:VWFA-related protein
MQAPPKRGFLMRLTALLVTLASTSALLVAGHPAQPSQRPALRIGVEVVEVDASVLDEHRRPVRGLAASDFVVLEDGRPQTLVSFAAIDVPPADRALSGWQRDIAPDVRNNLAAADRLIVMVLDDAQVRSGPQQTKAVKDLARGVVDRLGPGDLVAIVFTRDNRGAQPFTNDRRRLLAAIDGFHGEFNPDMSVLFGMSSLSTLRFVAESLADAAQRRKVVLYVSPGVQIDGPDQDERRREVRSIVNAAGRANVNIYGLDPSGLGGLDGEDAAAHVGSIQRRANDLLHVLATETRGRALVNRNDVDGGVNEVFDENASYYLLGYRSNDPDRGSRVRRIDVRVNRPGLTVRARNGYARTKPAGGEHAVVPDAVAAAMREAAPRGDIAMQMTAAAFAQPDRKTAGLAIAVAVRQPRLALGGRHVDHVTLLVGAYEPDGKRAASERLTARIALRDNGENPSAQYELLTALQIPPGRYHLRVAAESALHAKEGSIHYDVDVPDFTKGEVNLSGVLISVEPNVLVAGRERLRAVVPVVPTSRREFWMHDRVSAFVRVYQKARAKEPVTLQVQMRDANDRKVFERRETIATHLTASLRSADYQAALPLQLLPPGPYLLTIEATENRATVRRDVRFIRR